MNNQPSLGKRLARAREDAGFEQDAVAERLGLHAVTLSRYENDKRPVPAELRQKLAVLYGLPGNTFDDQPPTKSADGAGRPAGEDGAPTRRIEVDYGQAMYWLGRLDSDTRSVDGAVRTMLAVRDSIGALAELFRSTTAGAAELANSGLLGDRPPSRPAPEIPLVPVTDVPPETGHGGEAKPGTG